MLCVPFCLILQVASTVRVRPDDALQGYFATVTPGQVTVTGCLLTVVPKPVASIAPAMTVTNDVTYSWAVKVDSNAPNPLVVQYNKPVDVISAARVTRRPGQRSTSIQGSVQLMSQGISTLTVNRVQVRLHSWPCSIPPTSNIDNISRISSTEVPAVSVHIRAAAFLGK
jgi:hypothetical protein